MGSLALAQANFSINEFFRQSLVEIAKKERPKECCGIIATYNDTPVAIYQLKNDHPHPRIAWAFSLEEQYSTTIDLKKKNWEVGAIFHSHPSGDAFPSDSDVKNAYYPVPYIIIGFTPRVDIRTFLIIERDFWIALPDSEEGKYLSNKKAI